MAMTPSMMSLCSFAVLMTPAPPIEMPTSQLFGTRLNGGREDVFVDAVDHSRGSVAAKVCIHRDDVKVGCVFANDLDEVCPLEALRSVSVSRVEHGETGAWFSG